MIVSTELRPPAIPGSLITWLAAGLLSTQRLKVIRVEGRRDFTYIKQCSLENAGEREGARNGIESLRAPGHLFIAIGKYIVFSYCLCNE